MFGAVAIIAVALILALTQTSILTDNSLTPINTETGDSTILRFTSEQDIVNAFQNSSSQQGYGRGESVPLVGVGNVKTTAESTDQSAGGDGDATPSANPSYSQTNVQVEGVDEADIVKTDGKYIYTFYRNRLMITEAFPADQMNVVARLDLKNISPQEMFIHGNQLILFGSKWEDYSVMPADEETPIPVEADSGIGDTPAATEPNVGTGTSGKMAAPAGGVAVDMMYPYWGNSKSIVYVYDITDKANPQLEKELEFSGSYVSSRKVNEVVYFVMTSYPDYQILAKDGGSIIPMYSEDSVERPIAEASRIGYIAPIYAQQFITLGSLDLDDYSLEKETIVGSAEHVYSSAENMYITHTIWNYQIEPLPLGTIVDDDTILPQPPLDYQKTMIYKFNLNGGNVEYQSSATVPGRVLNQFSMDEYQGNVRIATTVDSQWDWQGQESTPSTNHVFVLDEDMEQIGSVNDLAKGESIYSARFIGERGYLVTFKKVDPLFVIDFSTPSNPQVLGKLKIPGYSDYLHPLDATHLIGVGKDAVPSKEGDFAWYQGMKLAVFDVTDVENPMQMHEVIIGDRGTDSYALQNHKAFLYDAEKELLVLPIYVHEVTDEVKKQYEDQAKQWGQDWESFPAYGVPTYQGAFVYHLNLQDGFVEKGRITHIDKAIDLKSGYYYDWEYQVQRALFIDNTLYTISQAKIKANDLTTLDEISEVEFPQANGKFTFSYSQYGVFCAGNCGSTSVSVTEEKATVDYYPGGYSFQYAHEEFEDSSYYAQLISALDWEAFDDQPDTVGCPGCADGAVENITITNGDFTAYISLNSGEQVEEIQPFLNKMRSMVEDLTDKAKSQ